MGQSLGSGAHGIGCVAVAAYVRGKLTSPARPTCAPLYCAPHPRPQHAYYLDHQHRRADYISIFLDHLVDYSVVERRYAAATASGP